MTNALRVMKDKDGGIFRKNVLDVVRRIPAGVVLTYTDVARQAGNSRAARAVGAILKTNFDPAIPCHRVVRSDGKLGGYNRGVREKARLLRDEKVNQEKTNTNLH